MNLSIENDLPLFPDHDEIRSSPNKYKLDEVQEILIKEGAQLSPKNNDPTMTLFNNYVGHGVL
jgi:hypothetical protein